MHRALFSLLVVAAFLGGASAAADDDVLLAHRLHGLDGDVRSLSDLRGQVVVVNFWASWCRPCRRELPVMDRWAEELAGDGVAFAAISIDKERRRAERFAERHQLTLPIYHDGADGLARRLDIPSLPYTLVLDRQGRVRHASSDSSDEALAALKRTIADVVASGAGATTPSAGATR